MKPNLSQKQFRQFNLSDAHLDELADTHKGLVEMFMDNEHAGHDHRVLGIGLAENPYATGRDDRLVFVMLVDSLTQRARLRLPTLTPIGVRIHRQEVGSIVALGAPPLSAPTPAQAGMAAKDTSPPPPGTATYRSSHRPVPGGVSIGPSSDEHVYSGTLGCEVFTSNGKAIQKYILSNNHVLADCNRLPPGSHFTQPSKQDGGTDADRVATLSHVVQLAAPGGTSPVDAAIAACDTVHHTPRIQRDNDTQALGDGITPVSISLPVQKSGRTTGHTLGSIAQLALTVRVTYLGYGEVTIQNAFAIVGSGTKAVFADLGDSGSLVTDKAANSPVGLLFATTTAGTPMTFANDIQAVLDHLGTVVGSTVSILYS